MSMVLRLLFLLILGIPSAGSCQPEKIPLGFIGSLSGPAASYGQAVLEGAKLAVKELNAAGTAIELVVEDDATNSKNTVTAFQKLAGTDKVRAIVAGSWWANSIVRPASSKKILLLSCETVYDKDTISGDYYFIMAGDLRDWIRVYEPLIQAKLWKSAAIIRFTSGFADTLAEELERVFSGNGRRFLDNLTFSYFDMQDAPQLVLQLKRLSPDVVFIDGQPAGFANVLRRMDELGLNKKMAVLTHSIARDVYQDRLVDLNSFKELYFTDRLPLGAKFSAAFRAEYAKPPHLHADLGYYSVYLAVGALQSADPLQALKEKKQTIDGIRFKFDERNVLTGMQPLVWTFQDGELPKGVNRFRQ